MIADTLIALGQLVGTHATRGELRLRLFNPDSEYVRRGSTIVLRRNAERLERCVTTVRPHKNGLLVSLEGCASMTDAEALIGYEVCVHEHDLPPAPPGEVYHYQLVGMAVVTTQGAAVGTVAEVLTTPGNDVCVVRHATGEHLIPLVAEVVKEIDREGRRLVIEPLPGLLAL